MYKYYSILNSTPDILAMKVFYIEIIVFFVKIGAFSRFSFKNRDIIAGTIELLIFR